ncbi:MAG: metallophosphoesterase family protein [Candidatus Dormibacteria bacterium]
MAWAGTATVWTLTAGGLTSCGIATAGVEPARTSDLFFVQISDSHIGFKGAANPDVTGTFAHAIAQVNALPRRPAFVAHTGDLTHLSRADEFDTVQQMLGTLRTAAVHVVPGEHDAVGDTANQKYLQFFGKGSGGKGYYSLDVNGVHLLFLVNTSGVENLGVLGREQLDFIKTDLRGLKPDTPLVVFSHIPLFAMYPKWGWYTHDSLEALSYMKRFSSVTCLNGHVHQLMSKTEGNITFHAATCTAYPLPHPGTPGVVIPSPIVLPAGDLYGALGIREASYVAHPGTLAVKDDPLR